MFKTITLQSSNDNFFKKIIINWLYSFKFASLCIERKMVFCKLHPELNLLKKSYILFILNYIIRYFTPSLMLNT